MSILLTKSPDSYGKSCSAPRALQVEKYSALTKFCSAPGTRAIGFFTAWCGGTFKVGNELIKHLTHLSINLRCVKMLQLTQITHSSLKHPMCGLRSLWEEVICRYISLVGLGFVYYGGELSFNSGHPWHALPDLTKCTGPEMKQNQVWRNLQRQR